MEKSEDFNEIKRFPRVLIIRKCKSDFTKRLNKGVRAVVENEEWRQEYMTLRIRDRENMEKGLAVGRAESIIELLEDIGEIFETLKETIHAEQNVDRLKEWLRLAKKADTIEEFQEKM